VNDGTKIILVDRIESLICTIRDQKVILESEVAKCDLKCSSRRLALSALCIHRTRRHHGSHDTAIRQLIEAIRQLMTPPAETKPRRRIGFGRERRVELGQRTL